MLEKYIEALQNRLRENPPDYGHTDINSLVGMLSDIYLTYNPVDTQQIRCRIQDLEPVMNRLDWSMTELLFDTVSSLCQQYEDAAFQSDFQMGLRLTEEVRKQKLSPIR